MVSSIINTTQNKCIRWTSTSLYIIDSINFNRVLQNSQWNNSLPINAFVYCVFSLSLLLSIFSDRFNRSVISFSAILRTQIEFLISNGEFDYVRALKISCAFANLTFLKLIEDKQAFAEPHTIVKCDTIKNTNGIQNATKQVNSNEWMRQQKYSKQLKIQTNEKQNDRKQMYENVVIFDSIRLATIGRHKCTLKHGHKHPNKYVWSIKCAQIRYLLDAFFVCVCVCFVFLYSIHLIFFFPIFVHAFAVYHTFDIIKCNTSYSDVRIQSLQYKSYIHRY